MKDSEHTKARINRRDFVRGTAAVVGSVMASHFPGTASAYFGVDDTIKVGLIGCGGRGTGAAVQALVAAKNARLVAMADAFEARVNESYGNLTDPLSAAQDPSMVGIQNQIDVPVEHRFVGFEAYRQVIPLVDVVILATPPGFRPIHFDAAIEAGKQVFMEKPVAVDAPGVRQILATAEKAKEKRLNVVVGLQRRYQTEYLEWVSRIHDGAIGDVILGRVYWNGEGVWIRDRASFEATLGRPATEMEYQMWNWYYFNWLCGDHIVEQHIHNIDVANWVKRSLPVSAQGQGGRQVRTGPDVGEIYDHHFVEFEYADGSRVFSQCRHIEGCMSLVSEGFHGTAGSAPQPGEILDAAGGTIYRHRGKEDPNPYQTEHDALFSAINAGEFKFADAQIGAEATMSAILGRMATYSGQVVTWDQAMASELKIGPDTSDTLTWDTNPPVLPNEQGAYGCPMPGLTQAL
ncbi:MAG TPA: Gfo/Idh/MocA family oxidoreductase [Rhodothermales bacterium]|nr:Gfo/Idh/MocA family oxidoreductase [Rhodothermales bacterium]